MAIQFQPVVGEWYETAAGDTFEVVAYDPDEQTIEIQYFDGAVEEMDLDTWLETPLTPAEAPEDWSGSLDLAREDMEMDLDATYASSSYSFLDDMDGYG